MSLEIIDVEVFRKALENLTEEMAITLKRASGSSIVVDTHDFCTAIFDAAGEQLAFSGWVTMHCASSLIGVRETVRLYADDPDLAPGDAIIVNDPYTSGALHQADVGMVMPMFHGDALVGWCFSNVHVLDIGGAAIGGLATTAHDMWEEALRFPPTKIALRGVLDPQWERFIANSVRMPDAVINDLRGLIAAGHTAQRKIDELLERYGPARYAELSDAAKDLTEDALREKIARLPDGTYDAQEWIEYDGHGEEQLLNLRCRLTIDGEHMTIALTGDRQVNAPVIGAPGGVIGCLMSAMLCMLTYDIPMNEGVWRHVVFDLGPAGTVVNPVPPAPVSLAHVGCGFRAGRAFNEVIAQACALSDSPELRSRVAGAPQNAVPVGLFFGDNQFGRPTVSVLISTAIGVGGGAQTVGDGQDCYGAQCMQGTRMPDIEVFEGQEPMLVLYRRLTPDSGGPGAMRGGMGMTEATVLWSTDAMRGVAQSHCERVPPRGVGGGLPGSAGRVSVIRGSDVRAQLAAGTYPVLDAGAAAETWPSMCAASIERDDVVICHGGGGGGLGDPLLRDAALVAVDVLQERVTPAVARRVYGVVLDGTGDVDAAATAETRFSLRRERLSGREPAAVRREVEPGVAVVARDSDWACAACDHALGRLGDNWRPAALLVERAAIDTLAERNQMLRERENGPRVIERALVCPNCASMLSVDVAMAGDPPDAAPRTRAALASTRW